ncbi:acyl-CoA dehydrogenase family protein [Corynebacterium sp. H113]|uniref:acyl-CoA dehydrogenase family protein n=1 Tax=Corynebacterium sp. H113 TaxID=3133419 RepID=UPI00309B4673
MKFLEKTASVVSSVEIDSELEDLANDVFANATLDEQTLRETWNTLSELGLARLTGSEELGGSGASWSEAACVARAAASQGLPIPYVESDLLAGWLLEQLGLPVDDAIRTVAFLNRQGHSNRAPWVREADRIVVVRPFGETDTDGYSSWQVADIERGKVSIEDIPHYGKEPRSKISLPNEAGIEWHELSNSKFHLLYLRGALARSVQVVAALETATVLAREHVVTRHQFGRPVARFQSVQNLIVDAVAEATLARSAVEVALKKAVETDLDSTDSAFYVAVAKSVVGRATSIVVRNTHQAMGAMGTTEEHSLHKFTNAALTWRGEFGSPHSWEQKLGEAMNTGAVDDVWGNIVEGVEVEIPAAMV